MTNEEAARLVWEVTANAAREIEEHLGACDDAQMNKILSRVVSTWCILEDNIHPLPDGKSWETILQDSFNLCDQWAREEA